MPDTFPTPDSVIPSDQLAKLGEESSAALIPTAAPISAVTATRPMAEVPAIAVPPVVLAPPAPPSLDSALSISSAAQDLKATDVLANASTKVDPKEQLKTSVSELRIQTLNQRDSVVNVWMGTLVSTLTHIVILLVLALLGLTIQKHVNEERVVAEMEGISVQGGGDGSPTSGDGQGKEDDGFKLESPIDLLGSDKPDGGFASNNKVNEYKDVDAGDLAPNNSILDVLPESANGTFRRGSIKGKQDGTANGIKGGWGDGTSDGMSPSMGRLTGGSREKRRAGDDIPGKTKASEDAVEKGLRFLILHQRKSDNAWRFDHMDGTKCDGSCGNPGSNAATTASTGVALLAFYGAGYTHLDGPYATQLNKALYYLGSRIKISDEFGGDLQEGTMYAQGIATIALSEAAALTGDATLRGYAERAIKFIIKAQHKDGGWRYLPGEPGDTTVTGWQLMALKSGQMAGIEIPSTVFSKASDYLDSVQGYNGALYGYRSKPLGSFQTPGPNRDAGTLETTTSVGLLCRMYMGWRRDHPGLSRGVAELDAQGVSRNNIYYNYYATQVMLHYGGEPWERWHPKMRDYLVATQSKVGHSAGSWYFPEDHNDKGGRLFNTTMAIMTLEMYYRHQPLYQKKAAETGF